MEGGVFKGKPSDPRRSRSASDGIRLQSQSAEPRGDDVAKRSFSAEHATVHKWAIRHPTELLERFKRCKGTIAAKWHVDETYIRQQCQHGRALLQRAAPEQVTAQLETHSHPVRRLPQHSSCAESSIYQEADPIDLDIKSLTSARVILGGIEMIHVMLTQRGSVP